MLLIEYFLMAIEAVEEILCLTEKHDLHGHIGMYICKPIPIEKGC